MVSARHDDGGKPTDDLTDTIGGRRAPDACIGLKTDPVLSGVAVVTTAHGPMV